MHPRSEPSNATAERRRVLRALVLSCALLSACLAPRPEREIEIEDVGRMMEETAVAPVQGKVVDGEAVPPAGDPTALARPEDLQALLAASGVDAAGASDAAAPETAETAERAAGEGASDAPSAVAGVDAAGDAAPDDPPPPDSPAAPAAAAPVPQAEPPAPFLQSPYLRFGSRILVHDIAGTTIITKPYPLPPGRAKDMVELMKVLHPFPFVVLSVDQVQARSEPPDPGVVELVVLSEWDREPGTNLRKDSAAAAPATLISDLLVATAGYELLEEVEDFVNLFAAGVRQVEIEAKIIEVTDSESLDIGVKPLDEDTPILDFPDGTLVDSFSWNFPNTVDPTEALLTLGTVQDQLAINAIIEALQSYENVSIDQRPKVIVREGVPANLSSTQEVPYFVIQSINPAGNFTSSLQFKSVGVEFYVAPRVVGTETLALDIVIEASQLIGTLTTFVTETGAALPTPLIAKRTAQTLVYLQPGQALVIGGLTSERKAESVRQIPILGDIPLLGALFRSKVETTDKSYVLFVISPRIVQGYEFQADF